MDKESIRASVQAQVCMYSGYWGDTHALWFNKTVDEFIGIIDTKSLV